MENKARLKKPSSTLVIAAFAAIYIIWGSTYLGILLAIESIPPFIMAGTRFAIAGLLLLGWCLFRGERFPDRLSMLNIAFSGLLMLFLGNGAVTWVEQYLPSGLAAILVATVPLWFVILDRRQWHFYFSNKGIIIGLLIGFAGVVLLFAGKTSADLFADKMKTISLFVLIGGTIAWTAGSLISKYREMRGSTMMKVALQMLAAGIAFFITAFTAGEHRQFAWSDVTASSLGALAYLVFMGSLVGYLAYMWLLSVRPPSLVGTYAYVNPVVAVFLGWLIASEAISGQQMIGLGIIILGLVMVNMYKEKKPVDKSVEQTVHTTATEIKEESVTLARPTAAPLRK